MHIPTYIHIYIYIYSDSVERTVSQKHVHYCTELKAREGREEVESARISIVVYTGGGCGIPPFFFHRMMMRRSGLILAERDLTARSGGAPQPQDQKRVAGSFALTHVRRGHASKNSSVKRAGATTGLVRLLCGTSRRRKHMCRFAVGWGADAAGPTTHARICTST